jgi:hypothetical protein
MSSYNKLYRYISICAIALLLIGRTIRKVFDIDLMPKYVKLFLLIIALNVWSYLLV